MDKILKALAEDKLCMNPQTFKGNVEYSRAFEEMHRKLNELDEKLSIEGKEIFEQYCDAKADENHIFTTDQFVRGFRLGVLIMLEVFDGTDSLLIDGGTKK